MPKKKQVTFQSNIPGKFIPRDDASSTSVFRNGTSANRFNSKMVELLASSPESSIPSIVNQENESISTSTRSTPDDSGISTSPETMPIDSSRIQSKLLHRRIATMLDTLRRRSGNSGTTSPPVSPRLTPTHIDSKSQPITFGQLRQANTNSSSSPPSPPSPPPPPIPPRSPVVQNVRSSKIVTANSYTDLLSMNLAERQSYQSNVSSDLIPTSTTNSERLIEQHHILPRNTEQTESKQKDEQQAKPPLTVDEILANYYAKIKVSSFIETQSPSPTTFTNNNNNNSSSFYIHSPTSGWNSPAMNPSPLLLNDQYRTRPPPPSYSLSVANGHRPPPLPPLVTSSLATNNLAQHLIRPPAPTSNQMPSHLLPTNTYFSPSIRPPPPRYESPVSNIERSHSDLSSANRPNISSINPSSQAGFDREFSRLLYGRDGRRPRQQRQKRKAFSDPVKKSVEEAGRSIEKNHRRLTTHLNRTDTVKEEEENTSDSTEIERHERDPFLARQFQRRSELIANTRESAKKPIVPANPLLKRRIPSFLRVYSQASSSNDILLQWHLFSSSDLESFDGMMKKLYKDENLTRVQMYENYRALLLSTLGSRKTSRIDDDDNGITTTAL